jgi:hypothetical protein
LLFGSLFSARTAVKDVPFLEITHLEIAEKVVPV